MRRQTKKHIFFMILMVVLILFLFGKQHLKDKIPTKNELMAMHYFLFFHNHKALAEDKQFPLWIDTMYGGTPFFALPQAETLLFHVLPLVYFISNPELSINITVLLQAFMAGLFMYLLLLDFKLKPKYAFVGAMVYIFNGFMLQTTLSWLQRYKVMLYLPLSFLFLRRALTRKQWFKYAILAGLFMALQFHGGGLDYFMFSLMVPLTYFVYQAIGKNMAARVLKVAFVAFVMIIIFLGLTAVKTMPLMEFSKVSSKRVGFEFKDSVGRHFSFTDVIKLPFNLSPPRYHTRIGVIAFLLLLIPLWKWRRREILFFYILMAVILLIATGSSFYYLLWKYIPGFAQLHHVERGLFVWEFTAAVLAAFGASLLFEKIIAVNFKKYFKYIIIIFFILLTIDLVVVDKINYYNYEHGLFAENQPVADSVRDQVRQNYLLQNVSKDTGLFRVENIATATHSGQSILHSTTLGLHQIYGATSLWIPEYFNVYLGFTHRQPAKFHGMLNVRYLYHDTPVNRSGLTFVGKFKECEDCWETWTTDHGVDGPYLYKNDLYLPRAYVVDNSILVIGEENAAKGNAYALMLENSFDPSNTVLVMKFGSVNELESEFLNKFSSIFLTQGSIDEQSLPKLQRFAESGGILMPNIFNGSQSVSPQEIQSLLTQFKGNYSNVKEMISPHYTPNFVKFTITEPGWLVLSEKYFMFEGWHCSIDNKEFDLHRADGIISALYLDRLGELECAYTPKSFRNGLIISILTLLFIIGYFVYKKTKRKPVQSSSFTS